MKLQENAKSFLNDKRTLRNARTITIFALALGAPFLYFIYKDEFSLGKLLSFEFGFLTLIVIITTRFANQETKKRTLEESYEVDQDLIDLKDKKNEHADTISELDPRTKRTSKILQRISDDEQETYNIQKTNKEIDRLKVKARDYLIKGNEKKADEIHEEIKFLESNPLIERNFEPYDIRKFINKTSIDTKQPKKKGNHEVSVDPTKSNLYGALIKLVIKSSTVGTLGALSVAPAESWTEIFIFYLVYTITMASGVFTSFWVTTKIIENEYKASFEKIIKIQEIIIEELETPQALIEHKVPHKEESLQENPFNRKELMEGV